MDLHSRLLGTDSNIFCAMSLSAKIAYVILPIVHQAHCHCHGNPACPKRSAILGKCLTVTLNFDSAMWAN